MKTLNRYITLIFVRFFLMILAALISLYALIDFLEKVDDFIEHGAFAVHYVLFPLYNLPLILSNTLPMAILLGAFATIGSLSRSSQLTALSGGGISFWQISRPLFACGLLLSGVAFLINAWLLPLGNRAAHYLLEAELSQGKTFDLNRENLYLRDANRVLSIAYTFPANGEIAGVSILEFDQNFMIEKRIEAVRGHFRANGFWVLEEVKSWSFTADPRQVSAFEQQPELVIDLRRGPEELIRQIQSPEDMTLPELFRHAEVLAEEGHESKPYQIESHTRLAKSVTPLIMILLGIPFALQRGRQASFSLGFLISLLIFMGYFLLQATFTAFANAAILPPWVAAWTANIMLGLIGTWLFLRMHN
jgi:lipopolysaccharide export system permease protein